MSRLDSRNGFTVLEYAYLCNQRSGMNSQNGSAKEAPIDFLSTTAPDSMYTLDDPTRDLLIESAPLMESWSATDCACKDAGGMEEWAKTEEVQPVASCDWYHGTWQYLRLLNMVAVPPWYEFYQSALTEVLRKRPKADVLISAAADYGMLATLHEAVRTANQGRPSYRGL